MRKKAWKLIENKSGSGLNSPRFYIGYDRLATIEAKAIQSRRLLSLLRQDSDLVIRIDSRYFNFPLQQEIDITNIIPELDRLGLDYRYRRYKGSHSPNPWRQILIRNNSKTFHEVMVYVSDQVWQNDFLRSLLWEGAFYYICGHSGPGTNLLDSLFNGQISEVGQLELFRLIIFDCISAGHMGLFTSVLGFPDIQELLKSDINCD